MAHIKEYSINKSNKLYTLKVNRIGICFPCEYFGDYRTGESSGLHMH